MDEGELLAGRYRLGGIIGRGGMAEVRRARDETLDRDVAVKILLGHHAANQDFRQRFRAEAHAAASLNHPNVVGVFDTGDHHDVPFIVMELVEGRSLAEAIRAGGLTEDRALEVCANVCQALQYAHDRNIVHRDIKPGNILLAEDGSVKVADFGIARAIDADTVTETAAILGTAAYLSPEQAQGKAVDARSDVYSLGVVLYELLCGHQPFTGDSPVTVAYQHVQELAPPPRDLDPTVSDQAEAIVMRALAKNPQNRYGSAAAMRDDLLQARTGGRVMAPAVLRRQDAPAAAVAAGAAGAGAAAGAGLLDAVEDDTAPAPDDDGGVGRTVAYALLALLTVAAVAVLVLLLTGSLGGGGDDTTELLVPTVTNQLQETAEEVLAQRGFDLRVRDQEFSDTVPAGYVISQDPSPGELAEEGSTVQVVVSLGAEAVAVPDLAGLSIEEARQALRDMELVPRSVIREANDEVPVDEVLRTDPPAGTDLAPNTPVDIVVSSGEETVLVANVQLLTDADARFRLEDQGLRVAVVRVFSDTVEEGRVVSQDPAPGAEVPVGSEVTLEISRGPAEPSPSPSPSPTETPTEEPTEEPPPTEPPPEEPPPEDAADTP